MWGAFVLPRTPQLNCQSDDGAEALHVIYGIYVPMIFTMRVGGGDSAVNTVLSYL